MALHDTKARVRPSSSRRSRAALVGIAFALCMPAGAAAASWTDGQAPRASWTDRHAPGASWTDVRRAAATTAHRT